jgi:cadmium resistance protein CadD (predicted permease)
MADLTSSVGAAASVFAVTNVDDLVLLAAFFSHPGARMRSVAFGQVLGIGSLVLVSAAAALAALLVPTGWTSALGVVPLGLGLRELWRRLQAAEQDGDEPFEAVPAPLLWSVAGVTFANGGDNLSVYIPMFASDPGAIPLYVAVFAVMTGVWIAGAWGLVHQPAIGPVLRRLGNASLPFVLIGLGVWILLGV